MPQIHAQDKDALLYKAPTASVRHSGPPSSICQQMEKTRISSDSSEGQQNANTSNHSIPLTKSKSIPRKEVIQTSTALSRGHLVAMAETDIAIGKATAVMEAVAKVRKDANLPMFPGEDIVLDVRQHELACTLQETKESMDLASAAVQETGPLSTRSKIAKTLFPHTSKQAKVETKIETARCLAHHLEERSEALLSKIEGVTRS